MPGADVSGHYEFARNRRPERHSCSDRPSGTIPDRGLPPDATLQLSANRSGDDRGARVGRTSKGSVTLRIVPEHAVALYGRIKDPAGRPLAGAIVRVSARKRGTQDIPIEQFTVAFDDEGRTTLHTGADGQFRTPRQLRPDLEYRVEVEADDYVPAGTEWVKPDDRQLWYFPAIVPSSRHRPARWPAGSSMSRAGRSPAPSCSSRATGRATAPRTDADGRFRLSGVYREPAFLFVEGDGLAFEGHRIGPATEPVELKVRRDGDPPPARRSTPCRRSAARGGKGPGPSADRIRPVPPDRRGHPRGLPPGSASCPGSTWSAPVARREQGPARSGLRRAAPPGVCQGPDGHEPGGGGHDRRGDEGPVASLAVLSRGQRRPAEDGSRRKLGLLDKALLHARTETDLVRNSMSWG